MNNQKVYTITHEAVVEDMDWSPSMSFIVLFSQTSVGVFNLDGVLLSNIEITKN